MKNIDKIKQNFIDAIKCMTVDQYNELNAVLCEECHYNQKLDFLQKVTFTCDDCKTIYGDCSHNDSDDVNECDERFEKYMNSDTDK